MSADESSRPGEPAAGVPTPSDRLPDRSTRDVTAASDSNAEDSETRYRELFESTGDAIMLLDASGFIECNQATLAVVWLSLEAGIHRAPPQ